MFSFSWYEFIIVYDLCHGEMNLIQRQPSQNRRSFPFRPIWIIFISNNCNSFYLIRISKTWKRFISEKREYNCEDGQYWTCMSCPRTQCIKYNSRKIKFWIYKSMSMTETQIRTGLYDSVQIWTELRLTRSAITFGTVFIHSSPNSIENGTLLCHPNCKWIIINCGARIRLQRNEKCIQVAFLRQIAN